MFTKIKVFYMKKIHEWTEEINNDRMVSMLKEILNEDKGEVSK